MTEQTVIPAGYRLTVKSWENDADNGNTVVLEGLTEPQARYLVDICKLFEHSNDYENRLCNMYQPEEDEIERVKAAIKKVAEKHGQDFDPEEFANDPLWDLGLSSEEFYTRVCADFRVDFIEAPVVMKNVTKEFV